MKHKVFLLRSRWKLVSADVSIDCVSLGRSDETLLSATELRAETSGDPHSQL